MKNTVVFLLGVVGTFLFVTASIAGGLQIEGYSFISQYISESYADGVPNVIYLRYMYIASGLLLALFGFMAPRFFPRKKGVRIGFLFFAIFYGLGTIGTGFFPCDYGCPSHSEVSLSQFIHNFTGFLTYAFVPFAVIGIGFSLIGSRSTKKIGTISLVSGIIALVGVALLFSNPTSSFIGLFQRIIESSILFWVLYNAFYIRRLQAQSRNSEPNNLTLL